MPRCSCTEGWRTCEAPIAAHCFVCGAYLCENCSRLVLTKDGWVRICACTHVCSFALRVVAARERAARA